MGSFLQTTKRVLKIIWRVFIALFAFAIVFFLLIQPITRGWVLHHSLLNALDHASSVKVVEHSCQWDNPHGIDLNYKEVTYATVILKQDQIESLREALPLRLDYSGMLDLMCIFEEHHYIEITEQDGSVMTLHICFHCSEIELNNEYQRIMPLGWYSSLSRFIISLGLHPNGPWYKKS